MKPFDSSSGDQIADRRADYARMLLASGDAAAAADLMLQATQRVPAWAYGWFLLGEMHEAAGATAAAIDAYRTARRLDPNDRIGAILKLQLAGALDNAGSMPAAFIETLFDQYAGKFEQSLVGKLAYRAPRLMCDAIVAVHPGRFASAIDLGCGTGLMGEMLRPLADRLEGVDISAGMLREAMQKGIYDDLVRADLTALRYDAPRHDLAAGADVYIYVGALDGSLANAATMLLPGGLMVFSVEELDAASGFALRRTRRYAHSEAHVRAACAATGFDLVALERDTIRMDRDEPVGGLFVTARRR